ncbi:energy-coupling factor transporter transmembrane component T family protein [Thermodesulfobacteriota bacterium]
MYKLGQYIPTDSPIHKLDPRVKIISVILISIMTLNESIFNEVLFSSFLLIIFLITGLSYQRILNTFRPVLFFFVLLFILHLLFTQGTPIPPFPNCKITVTYEGFFNGLLVIWKFGILIFCASILTMTTSPTELIIGIERLLRPLTIFRVPSHDIATMVSIALRFVPTLLEEIERIKDAQIARGADFTTGKILSRIKAIKSLMLPVILSAIRRADELAIAMEGRAYQRGHRSYLKELCISKLDYIALGVMVLLTGLHIYLGYLYPGF